MTSQWQRGDKILCDVSFKPDNIVANSADALPDGFIAGIASTPSLDKHGHKVMKGAFDASIKERGLTGPRRVKLLAHHDGKKVAGSIKRLETIGDKLQIAAQLNMNVSYVKDLYEITKMDGGLSFSVGFYLKEFDWIEDDKEPHLAIKSGDLTEVSIVAFPSQEEAVMTFVKSDPEYADESLDTMMEFERALVADGLCNSRSHAHKVARWAAKNVHLLQPKPPLLGDEATQLHPLLDDHSLRPMTDLLAKFRSILTDNPNKGLTQ
jgi:HK97 family phage prohead protease